jgi:hypothetical protein
MPLAQESPRRAHNNALLVGGHAQFRQIRQRVVAHGARPHFHQCQRVAVVSDQIDFAFCSAGPVIARDEHVAMTPQVPVAVGFAADTGAAPLQL